MAETIKKIIGIMDPNYFSFRGTLEALFAFLKPRIKYGPNTYEIVTRRITCRPYDALRANSTCSVILNRGAHWNPHHNSFFTIVSTKVHLINDMNSFGAINKNAGYGQMHELGIYVPPTVALPPQDYSELLANERTNPDLIFSEHELFDLHEIGNDIGYPAYLKPQSGGGWVGVVRVNNYEDLLREYNKSGEKPMNLQKAVDYTEFVRSVGVGPQIMPMHYNAEAPFSHDRYMRSPTQAVDFNFLTPEQSKEVKQIAKLINAFYGWDHNSCEALIAKDGTIFAIDFCNAYPDSSLVSLHFYFPDLIKAMARWLMFCCVKSRKKYQDFTYNWKKYFDILDESKKKKLSYHERLDLYEKVADEHFDTAHFEEFCQESLGKEFDEKAFEFFASKEFDKIMERELHYYFKVKREIPMKLAHYGGIHRFWLHCEQNRLSREPAGAAKS
ncbi:MAG: hypothetical protein HYU64_18250 [Armatimonadetes bacterium]|nr:hypothetical protein [Armatimonadota bacterium]